MEQNGSPELIPPESWSQGLSFASEYMEAARQKHILGDPGSPTPRGISRPPSLRSDTPDTIRTPMNVASGSAIVTARVTTQKLLDYYEKLEAVKDVNIDSFCDAVRELDWTLFDLTEDLPYGFTLEGGPSFGYMIMDLQSSQRRLEKVLKDIFKKETVESSKGPSRPASVVYSVGANGEKRESWTCSFRQHTSIKLINSIEEVKSLIDPIIDILHFDLDRSSLHYQTQEDRSRTRQSKHEDAAMKLSAHSTSESRKLCSDCFKMFNLRETWPINIRRHEFQPKIAYEFSMRKLYETAKKGCQFCQLLHNRLLQLKHQGMAQHVWEIARAEVQWWKYWEGSMQPGDEHDASILSKDFEMIYRGFDGRIFSEDHFVTKAISKEEADRVISNSTNSKQSLAIAKSWIVTCLQKHQLCSSQPPPGPIRRPSRLIFVGIDDTVQPRIMEKAHIPPEAKYMTLSHRWGGENLIRLTTTNYADFTRQIDKAVLPKTFLDAMEVTRQLGVFYLWIDSLCIIQDSDDDWQAESSLMSDVYSGSWCNIAATRAEDSDSGLYAERDSDDIRGCIVEIPASKNVLKVELDLYGSVEWENTVSKSPLMRRGWVLQEATLAPRTLHFGYDRLFWQCQSQKASEHCPLELQVHRMRYSTNVPPEDEDDDKHFHGPSGWANIVHKYTRCDLSFPAKDKLVAISGIAKKYGPDDEYLAGLWRQDLLLQLTWRAFTGKGRKSGSTERPIEYQAPSWSWASINREIKYSWRTSTLTRIQEVAKVISANVELISHDKFGQVADGKIRMQGSLAKIEYDGAWATDGPPINWDGYFIRRIWPDLHSSSEFVTYDRPENRTFPVDMDYPEDLLAGDIFYCMPIFYEREKSGGPQCTVHGLVLERTRKARGQFFRRGTILFGEGKMGGSASVWDLEDCCVQSEKIIPVDCYESRDGHKNRMPMYTVTLV